MSDTVVLTSYLTNKQHPQAIDPNTIGLNSSGFVDVDSYEYIKPWYESLIKCQLDGVVFHQNLSYEFIYNKHSKFLTWARVSDSEYTNNDYRFFAYLEYLKDHDDHKYVVMSDCCDVTIKKDPSTFFAPNTIYFCEDTVKIKDYNFAGIRFQDICSGLLLLRDNYLKQFMIINGNQNMLNMGVIGGERDVIIKFLEIFAELRSKSGHENFNANMTVGNVVALEYLTANKFYGFPFCSEYKKNQLDREDVYFVHK